MMENCKKYDKETGAKNSLINDIVSFFIDVVPSIHRYFDVFQIRRLKQA